MLGTDPKGGAWVSVEEAGVVAVGAEVSVASDTDPQAITASMIARQDVIRTLWNIILIQGTTSHNRKCISFLTYSYRLEDVGLTRYN